MYCGEVMLLLSCGIYKSYAIKEKVTFVVRYGPIHRSSRFMTFCFACCFAVSDLPVT